MSNMKHRCRERSYPVGKVDERRLLFLCTRHPRIHVIKIMHPLRALPWEVYTPGGNGKGAYATWEEAYAKALELTRPAALPRDLP